MDPVSISSEGKGIVFVRGLLQSKGADIWSVTPETLVYDALRLMADKNIGAVIVRDASGGMQGIFSERDYARKIVLKGRNSRDTHISEVMTKRVFYVEPNQKVDECMALMTAEHIRHMPVLEDGKLIGVISIGDVVKSVISKQEFLIEQLEHYIMGRA
ncbi:MAG TPA: CBS domain-containing protein [Spirochaetia bacterium]|nr:CBS domain-containing protein [Spirochaetia bacterium]